MRQTFEHKNFRPETLELIGVLNGILEDYAADGYDLTVRQLYYQLVAQDMIENTQQSYSRIADIVSKARLAGLIDWNHIVDRSRVTHSNGHWTTPAHILRRVAQSFRIDRWDFQPVHVEVMCEKQALEGVLRPACAEWDVPFTANKGYPSQSLLYSRAQELHRIMKEERKSVIVLYYGDHDPSGLDMDRDVEERLRTFTREDECEGSLSVERMALTMPQIEVLRPPPNPAKITDSRAKKYIKKFGAKSWELDAMEPRQLVETLDGEIESILENVYGGGSQEIWDMAAKLEEEMKASLANVHKEADKRFSEWSKKMDVLYDMRYRHLP